MAKVVITIEDDESGVDAHASFDPNLPKEGEQLTPAQRVGLVVLTTAFPPDDEGVEWTTTEQQSDE